MLDAFALVSVGLFSLATLVVAVHLLILAARTGETPELLLGSSFLLTLIGNTAITLVLVKGVPTSTPRIHLIQGGALVVDVGLLLAAVFIAVVYRRGVAWATGLVWALSIVLLSVQVFTWVEMDPGQNYMGLFWLKFALRDFVYVWGGTEAFLYYRLMQKRVRYGISGPVIANRFLLWAIASGLGVIMVAAFQLGVVMGYGTPGADVSVTVGSYVGLPAALLFWLTFFAPDAYRRWITRLSRPREAA